MDVQGGALGLSASFDSLARFLGPAAAAELYKWVGMASPYWIAGTVMAIAFAFALSQRSRMAVAAEPGPSQGAKDEVRSTGAAEQTL
jgi:hypothetical protein